MTTYTTAELATRIYRDSGLYGAEETVSAADSEFAVETIQSEVPAMATKGVVIWNGSEVTVPQEYLTTVSRYLVLCLGPAFGMFDLATAEAAKRELELNWRRMNMVGPTGQVAEATHY